MFSPPPGTIVLTPHKVLVVYCPPPRRFSPTLHQYSHFPEVTLFSHTPRLPLPTCLPSTAVFILTVLTVFSLLERSTVLTSCHASFLTCSHLILLSSPTSGQETLSPPPHFSHLPHTSVLTFQVPVFSPPPGNRGSQLLQIIGGSVPPRNSSVSSHKNRVIGSSRQQWLSALQLSYSSSHSQQWSQLNRQMSVALASFDSGTH